MCLFYLSVTYETSDHHFHAGAAHARPIRHGSAMAAMAVSYIRIFAPLAHCVVAFTLILMQCLCYYDMH